MSRAEWQIKLHRPTLEWIYFCSPLCVTRYQRCVPTFDFNRRRRDFYSNAVTMKIKERQSIHWEESRQWAKNMCALPLSVSSQLVPVWHNCWSCVTRRWNSTHTAQSYMRVPQKLQWDKFLCCKKKTKCEKLTVIQSDRDKVFITHLSKCVTVSSP